MRLKEKLGIFYYFYFGLLFLVIGSLISFLGELKLGDFLCNFLRIIGFIVALFGGYYFLKFFILDAEKSMIAEKMGFEAKGEYAIKVR